MKPGFGPRKLRQIGKRFSLAATRCQPQIPVETPLRRATFVDMSVAEIKSQADALSFEELADLSRHLRALALRKDPRRQAQLRAAQESKDWLSKAEFERALDHIDRGAR